MAGIKDFVKLWRGNSKLRSGMNFGENRGRYWTNKPDLARYWAQGGSQQQGKLIGDMLGKVKSLKIPKKIYERINPDDVWQTMIKDDNLLKKQKTDVLQTIMARAGSLSKLALKGLSVVASLPAQVVVMTLSPTDANADEVNMNLEDFAKLADEAQPKKEKEMMAAGGNVPSTDIKDYWRRSWGIGDRQPQRRLKAAGPLLFAPAVLPAVGAALGLTGTGLILRQKVQNYFDNNPDALPKVKEWVSKFIPTIHGGEELEKIEPVGGKIETWEGSYKDTGIKVPEKLPESKGLEIPSVDIKPEGSLIPEQKGWQEFILYNKAIGKKIKDNAPAPKEKASDEYLDAVRELVDLHDGNIEKALRSVKLNREYVRAKFYQRGQKLEGTGGQIIETIKPIENIELFTEYTSNLKSNPSQIDEIYNEAIKTGRIKKEDKYLNIKDIANAIGMDISTKGSKNQLLKLLEEDVRKTDEARSVAKKYHINDVIKKAKEWSSQKLMEGDEPSSSKRYKHVQKTDASLFTENNKVIKRIRELTQLDKTYLEDQIEDIGHPESVRTSEKYKDLLKNINTIQDYVFQDKDINRDVIQTQGHAGDMESIYKKLNKLLNKTNVNKELIKIQKEIDARLKKTKKQIRDHKEYTIGKNQDKRIARIEITLPQEGEAFTANNLGVDLSNVDKKWIMGKVDLINPEAKKFDDLNDNQKEIYRANLNDQYLEMIGKIYKEAGYGKGEILDIQETISEGTYSKKGVLEKARGGPILSGVDQYILDRYK